MENIILADCETAEVQSLADELKFNNKGFTIKSHIANGKRTGKLSEIKRYLKYFAVAFKYFLSRKKYGAIVGWQQFYTLIFVFYCSLFRVKKRNTIVVLSFIYKDKNGKFAKIYKWFMKKCTSSKYIDYMHVSSDSYADKVSREFDFPRERIIAVPFGINYCDYSHLPVPDGFKKDGYALAIGRSNRDYDFLINAWQSIDYPLVIISDTYSGKIPENSNITHLTNVVGEDSYNWIAHCGLMIIPIDDGNVCSGDTVLLTAMSQGRKIIVTAPSNLAQMYVTDKVNALLTKKNNEEFKNTVLTALNQFENMGNMARQTFLENFSRSSMGSKINQFIN